MTDYQIHLPVTGPLASSGSTHIHSAHLGEGQGKPTLDTQLSLSSGANAPVPPEPAMGPKEAGGTRNSREAEVRKRAETKEGREIIERALCAFVDPAQNPFYAKRFGSFSSDLPEKVRFDEVVAELRKENCKQKLLDFVASYQADNSQLH